MVEPKNYWESKAEQLKNDRKFEEAIKILDKVQDIKKEEKSKDFWYKKAVHYYDIGEYALAKDSLNKDVENNQSYDSFFLMGKILYKLEKYEESLECYNKASEEYNRKHLKHSHKIDHMKKAHKFEDAVKYSDLVHQEKKLENDYWLKKGLVFQKLGKYNSASSCYETVLENDPKNSKVLYALAKSKLFSGEKKKSLEMLEKACLIEPSLKAILGTDKDFEPISKEKEFQLFVD